MSTFEDAKKKSLEFFKGDELAADTFVKKYALKKMVDGKWKYDEKTPDDMHMRLAKEFFRIESKYPNPMSVEEIFSLFEKFKYIIPQGSPMSVIGNPYQISSISNCVVLPRLYDSYGGICYADQQVVQLSKRRCGVGLDISPIRPKGMPVKNSSLTTDGIAGYMERFSNSIREVGQSGRRGAEMLTISVHHPEVITFATIKKDLNKVTGANISIFLTDEFMEAVEKGEKYELRWPVDAKKPKYSEMVDARQVWKTIIHNAWATAEPGLMFIDSIVRDHPASSYAEEGFLPHSSNPCQPSFATIIKENGLSNFGDLKIGDKIWSKLGWTTVINKWSNGIKKVYKYRTTSGVFCGTENHRIVSNEEKIEVKDADSIDVLVGPLNSSIITFNPLSIMDGLVIGDGSRHPSSKYKVYLTVGENDQDYFKDNDIKSLFIERHAVKYENAWKINTTIIENELENLPKREIPDRFIFSNEIEKCSFLRGLYSANGTIVGGRVVLKTTSKKMVEQVQLMLSSIGIKSYFTTNKPSKIKWSNGEYVSKKSYDINITSSSKIFENKIGFIQRYKSERLNELNKIKTQSNNNKNTYDIKEIEYLGEFEVFDITVDNEDHTYWTGGCNVSNCSEISMNADTCRLMAVNMSSFVDESFTENAKFNFDKWSEVIYKAQRLMDDMVDLEIECMQKIIDKIKSDVEPDYIKAIELRTWEEFLDNAKKGRRTGLGVTGVGDAVAYLNIKYGSEDSIKFIDKVFKTKKIAEYNSSINLAKERGPFEIYNFNKEKDNAFIKQLIKDAPEIEEGLKKYGRRQISLSTIAPTGSVSILTQTTSGIEPVFSLSYIRRKKINANDSHTKIDSVDQLGDKWQHFTVYHHGLNKWMQVTGKNNIEESPYAGSAAHELNYEQRVRIQAAAQKHIDHAISSTVNLPSEATEKDVASIYLKAWKAGLKGITVYRNGCRDGVLITGDEANEKDKKIQKTSMDKTFAAIERPAKIPCDIYQITADGERWAVLVGLIDGDRPYEVFCGKPKKVELGKTEKGYIEKENRGIYSLHIGQDTILKDISDIFNSTQGALTRMISTSLRHGVDIQFIVQQLEKSDGTIFSFSKAISRVLKKYIKDGTIENGIKCQECGGSLVREEGCIKCSLCAWTKCN